MIIRKSTFVIAVALLTIIPFLPAQQAPAPPFPPTPPKMADSSKPMAFYRLDFVIRELEGEKLVDTRNYSLSVKTGQSERITAGSEVPYATSNSSMSYRKTGVSINCTLQETEGNPWLYLAVDISSVAPAEKGVDPYSTVFRSTSFSAEALLVLGKSTTVSSVDDPATKRRLIVDVTATKLK